MRNHARTLRRCLRALEARSIADGTLPMFAVCCRREEGGTVVTMQVLLPGGTREHVTACLRSILRDLDAGHCVDLESDQPLPRNPEAASGLDIPWTTNPGDN